MKKLAFAAALLCVLTLPSVAAPKKATVRIVNQSQWELHHIYLSAIDDDGWGPDRLGKDVLAKGEALTIAGIACGLYDVKVVDADGDECIVEEVDLCGNRSHWTITDKDLLDCDGYR